MRLLYVLIGAVLTAQGFMLLEQRRAAERADSVVVEARASRLAADRAAQAATAAAAVATTTAEQLRAEVDKRGGLAHRVLVLEDAVAELEQR